MKPETKNCQNCKKDFTVEPEDFNFYEKIKVPPPTWCSECRLIRRLLRRPERSFFKNKCDKCNDDIVTIFAPELGFKVFCSSCWWGDEWDAIDFGRDYDFSKSFFQQFNELQRTVPLQATNLRNCENSKYGHGNVRCKNCTFVFASLQSINCYYCQAAIFTKDSFDSDVTWNADHVYETVNSNSVYNTKFVYFSDECLDSAFLFNCIGCTNCFGCVNLRNKKYCIWNKQYSKEQYQNEIKKFNLGSFKDVQEIKKKFFEIYYKIPRRFALILNSNNVLGDDLKNTRNCKNCFVTRDGVENCKNIFTCGLLMKDSYDVTFGGDTSELLYEVQGTTQSHRTLFVRGSNNAVDVQYSDEIYGGEHLFGCISLRQKKYCILNKQYTKEEYETLVPKIKKHMMDMPYIDSKNRVYGFGEFFPPELSPWGYNESWANKFFPLSKKMVLDKGYLWHDDVKRNYKITIKSENLPDDIKNVPDSILNDIIECGHRGECNEQCSTAFRILPNELQFYRQVNLALPKLCPNCRYYERLKMINPPKLWHRKCMCDGVSSSNKEYKNTIKHNHGDKPCVEEFETAISKEI